MNEEVQAQQSDNSTAPFPPPPTVEGANEGEQASTGNPGTPPGEDTATVPGAPNDEAVDGVQSPTADAEGPLGQPAQAPLQGTAGPADDDERRAKALDDAALIKQLRNRSGRHRESILPYLREGHERFSQLGRRVPVDGFPSWTEFVEDDLGLEIRTVQRWLVEPSVKKSRGGGRPKPKPKPDPSDTVRIEIPLSTAEAERLVAIGKNENPTATYFGIYQAALRAADLPREDAHDEASEVAQAEAGPELVTKAELLDLTYDPIAAVFIPLRDKAPEEFVVKLRSYFQSIADRLTSDTQHLLVHVVSDDLGEVINEAA
jgi:hypothetical protein